MQRFSLAVLMALLLLGARVALADSGDCPPGTYLKPIGTVATASGIVSTIGHEVRASRIACAGTACVAGVYNADSLGAMVDADIVDEPGAPANTSIWTEYSPPLSLTEGITVVDDGNVNAIQLYECRR